MGRVAGNQVEQQHDDEHDSHADAKPALGFLGSFPLGRVLGVIVGKHNCS
jgi:hypothetical protein